MANAIEELSARVRDGRTDLVFDLLAAGWRPGDDVDLFRWCAYYGDASAVRRLVEAGADLSSLGENLDVNGAAFHGWWQLCEFLIEAGADPNRPLAETGETPLHAALSRPGRSAQREVVRALLAGGAAPNARALDGAETGGFLGDVRTRGETPLHRAAAYADAATIELLLSAGADREAADATGETPLAWAGRHLRPSEIARLLCWGDHRVPPQARWTGDHGAGLSRMEENLVGRARSSPRD